MIATAALAQPRTPLALAQSPQPHARLVRAQSPQPHPPLALARTIVLPDVRGRIDHLDVDVDNGRLFVAALGNDSVEVVDVDAGRRHARIRHLQEPQGVAYLADSQQLVVTNGRGGRVDLFAAGTLTPAAHADGLDDADNVRYDAARGRVYVGYGRALAELELPTLRIVNRIALAGHPESFQLEETGGRMFVNVPAARHIAVVDRRTAAVTATWNLGDASANFPMALDEERHRLFIATRRPAALLVYDTESGNRVARVAIGNDADDLFFDRQRRRLYAVCGEGVVDVVDQRAGDRYEASGRIRTAPGARTGLFVPTRRALYVAVPARSTSPTEIRVYHVD